MIRLLRDEEQNLISDRGYLEGFSGRGYPPLNPKESWPLKLVLYDRQPVAECMVLDCSNFYLFKIGMHWIDNVIERNWNDSTWNF